MKRFLSLLTLLRFREVFLMTGFSLIGALFGMEEMNAQAALKTTLLFVITLSLFLAIYALNNLFGYKYDLYNPRLAFLGKVGPSFFLFNFLILLAFSLSLLATVGAEIFLLGAAILFLWTTYYIPRYGLKFWPFSGTIAHFIGQILHFHLGYMFMAPVSKESMIVSIYFALLFSAGHLHHENIDLECDKKVSIKTTAVLLGPHAIFYISYFIFGLAATYWGGLYFYGHIPLQAFVPFFLAFLFQNMVLLIMNRKLIHSGRKILYRNLYRFFYFMAGMSFLFSKALIHSK